MEPVISKLQEGVKYPRFERDATTIINDLIEHITKERGVYSSNIEPNPNEHKIWFNTNDNTLNIYENGRWNVISVQDGGTINDATINNATISGGTLIGSINASGATISDGTISGGTISGGTISEATINGCKIDEGGRLNYGNLVLVTYTGTVTNPILMPNGGVIGYHNKSIKISNVTISGSKIEANRIDFISGNNRCMIYPLGSYLTFSESLADMTLSHSIDLNYGSIVGLTSIKTLSYTGLTIEPYNITGTGTPIIIHGRAAGVDIGANNSAHVSVTGITQLSWKQGSSYGHGMTFHINDNIINSIHDTFNITNGIISGSANINLTLSGTISGGTISGVIINSGIITGSTTINGATISGATINGATISYSTLSGSISASDATINGATLGGINITSGRINYTNINNAYISDATLKGTINATNVTINAGSKILATCTGSNPMLIPNGGNIGNNSASLTLCGITLTGGDFTKLKNLQ